MNKVVPKGYMMNPQGHLVPVELVKEIDVERDCLVREIVGKATELSQVLADFKKQAMDDVDAFVALSHEKYGVKRGGAKGNLSLVSYDGAYKITIAVADKITFDERLHAAKQLIDECLHEWTENGRSEIKVIVNNAFKVDKTGNLNVKDILGLRHYEISDEKWMRAMAAINDSLQVSGSKRYMRIYQQNDQGKEVQINLDLAAL